MFTVSYHVYNVYFQAQLPVYNDRGDSGRLTTIYDDSGRLDSNYVAQVVLFLSKCTASYCTCTYIMFFWKHSYLGSMESLSSFSGLLSPPSCLEGGCTSCCTTFYIIMKVRNPFPYVSCSFGITI